MTAHAAACRNHPEREALGVCVVCRARVCAECVTKIDGVNHCAACLDARAAVDAPAGRDDAGPARPGRTGARLAAVALFVVATLLTWGLVEVALPGSGG